MIQPQELRGDTPHGPWSCRGPDIWAMLCASRDGDIVCMQALLEKDPNLYRCEYWYTRPILFAVREGHLAALELLLEAGADPSWRGLDGEDLTVWARDRGHEAVAQCLEAARSTQSVTMPPKDQPIHRAAAENHIQAIRTLWKEDPSCLGAISGQGAQPLHTAVAHQAEEAVSLLITLGADLHARHGAGPANASGYAPVGFEPLDLAFWRGPFWNVAGHLGLAQTLLQGGVPWDAVIASALGDLPRLQGLYAEDQAAIHQARANGKHALSTAIEFGHEDIARWLLDHGADPNQPDGAEAPKGTALHAAARLGMLDMVKLLIAKGADPNSYIDSSGSAAYVAKTPEIRRFLIDHGGHLDPYDLIWLGDDEAALQQIRSDPSSALAGCGGVFAAACTLHKKDLLKQVLDAGIRVPAMLTACRSYLLHDPDMLRMLLESGMDPDLPNWMEATLLHCLCSRDSRGRPRPHAVECAGILFEAGASLRARDDHYRSTPLAWAARHNLLDMAQWLIQQGSRLHQEDDTPWATPLAWAQRRGLKDMIHLLTQAGATH